MEIELVNLDRIVQFLVYTEIRLPGGLYWLATVLLVLTGRVMIFDPGCGVPVA